LSEEMAENGDNFKVNNDLKWEKAHGFEAHSG
jgi:hypothetical protein